MKEQKMIPQTLIRTVPAETSAEVELFWQGAKETHPGWEFIEYREPVSPSEFPVTSPHWHLCKSGAQKAGLIRLEALYNHGGFYLDSDVEVLRSFETLRGAEVVAGWEDKGVVPDAVIGAEPVHPVIAVCIELALQRLQSGSRDWRTGNTAWGTGPGVTTTVFTQRPEVLLLPPGSFYPYHYTEKDRRHEDFRATNPWAFCAHHWHHSWKGH